VATWQPSSDNARSELLERRIKRWKERMRLSGEWISIAAIADWCSRENGSIRAGDRLKEETYQQIGESLALGEFEEGGRSRMVYPEGLCLQEHRPWIRMTRENGLWPEGLARVDALELCWIPRELARRWLVNKRAPLPPSLFSEDVAQDNGAVAPAKPLSPRAMVAAKKLVSLPQKRRGPHPTERNRATAMMVEDIRAGKRTLDDLRNMKQDSLADCYGLKSRDTARKALASAVAEIVGISNSDK
jgi:hypothetical protein